MSRLRDIIKEQVFLMELDKERALEALPRLLPTTQLRDAAVEAAQQLLDLRGTPHPDELARFHQVKQLLHLETEPLPGPRSPAKLIGKPADAI